MERNHFVSVSILENNFVSVGILENNFVSVSIPENERTIQKGMTHTNDLSLILTLRIMTADVRSHRRSACAQIHLCCPYTGDSAESEPLASCSNHF